MSAGEQAQVQDEPDDGLTPEERTQFEEMRATPTVEAPETVETEAKPEGEVEAKPEAKAEGAEAETTEGDDDEGEAAEGAVDATGKKPPRRVRFAKYERDIRARDKEIADLKAAAVTNADMQARLDERMKIINEALTPKQQQQLEEDDPEPDSEQDIFAHNQWLKRQLVKTQKMVGDLQGGIQQQTAQTNVERSYVGDVQRFAATEPKFMEGYNFLMQSRVSELALYYFDKEPSQLAPQELQRITGTIEDEENQLVASALQQGRSPAQRIFNLAKARGYKPQAAPDTAGGKEAANGKAAPGNLAEAAAATEGANGAAKPSVKEEIQRVKAGVEASVSLSSGGGAPARTITPQMLASMPQDEFDALMDTLTEPEQKRLMGG